MIKLIKILTFSLFFLLSGCALLNPVGEYSISIIISGQSHNYKIPPASTVQQALDLLNVKLSPLDQTQPSLGSLLSDGDTIRITKVTEEYEIEESVLPFEQQSVKNESIPEGQSVRIQAGVNGRIQTTYRIIFQDGIETSRVVFKSEVIQSAKPEITMIGVQSPFIAQNISGVLAYITSSNAWIMENNTGNRRPLITTGDLDGRIFTISPDRKWLLFSRSESGSDSEHINSLWLLDLSTRTPVPIDTGIRDVVHFADWVPGSGRTFSYSTVEPRSTPPGWQANNDLILFRFDDSGNKSESKILVDSNSGGLYGWWGTTYQWSPDGSQLAFARPDSIGLINRSTGDFLPLVDFPPYQPKSDWAWVPGIAWSGDNNTLFTVIGNNVANSASNSSSYDLTAITMNDNVLIPLVRNCGLFCYPLPSDLNQDSTYLVSFLSSIIPDQSETSRYSLRVMDKDGSDRVKIYPGEGLQGLNPQQVSWSPADPDSPEKWIAFIAQGNIMLAQTRSGSVRQVTGDGSVSKLIWR